MKEITFFKLKTRTLFGFERIIFTVDIKLISIRIFHSIVLKIVKEKNLRNLL